MFRVFSIIFLTLLAALGVQAAATPDDDFLAAREAFRVGDRVKLAAAARKLNGHELEPYVQYWQLRLRIEDAAADEVQALMTATRDSPVSDQLRADWLKVLGKRQDWETFAAEFPQLRSEQTEVACYALQAGLPADAAAWRVEARRVWLTGRELPDSCTAVFDTLAAQGGLAEDDLWARVRLALEAGNVSVARHIAHYLPEGHGLDARTLSAISSNPQGYLDRKKFNLTTRGGRETVMFATHRLARSLPALAAAQWEKLGGQFSEAERGYVWAIIAYLGAVRLDPNALAWYAQAGNELTDLQAAWKVRAALRAQAWRDVLATVAAMPPQQQQDPAWRYWKARALKSLGRAQEAQTLLAPLAQEFSFYGQLATEELGGKVASPAHRYQPQPGEVQAAAQRPGFKRALAFYRMNLRFEGNREWSWAIRGLDDKQLLAAAEFARRNEIWDRTIYTADRTRELHDFSLRYLAPYREAMSGYAAREGLDEAWVYGLIRQESRFIQNAKSSAGALGLMQLMPATARWAAKKMGLRDWRAARAGEVDTNLSLGTWYLRHVYETLDSHPVLASAAYNAGPGRARAWRPDTATEGAIYAETIPFNETRDYVKKVMSNATYYAYLFTQQFQSLKARMGVVAPRNPEKEQSLDDEP